MHDLVVPLGRYVFRGWRARVPIHGRDPATEDLLVARECLFTGAVEEKVRARLHGIVPGPEVILTGNVDINILGQCQSRSTSRSRRPCWSGIPACASTRSARHGPWPGASTKRCVPSISRTG